MSLRVPFKFISFLMVCIGWTMSSTAQVKISGKVIDEFDLTLLSGVKIQTDGGEEIGVSDSTGNFLVKSVENKELVFLYIGMEPNYLTVTNGCANAEINML